MVLIWRLTFLRQGLICFPMHLCGAYTFIWEKCWKFLFWTSLKTTIQLSWNLMAQPPSWKSSFNILPKPLVELSWNLLCSNRTTSGLKWAKIVSIRNPRWPPQPPSWKSVLTSSHKPQGKITWNLQCNNRLTCRGKIAEIMPIWNPKWLPQPPSWKLIFDFSSQTVGRFELKHTVATGWPLDWK